MSYNQRFKDEGGDKDDGGKTPLDLLPWDSVLGVARVFGYGATKYSPRNWHGLSKSRLFAATMRHLVAWWLGEDDDPETGESHLYHAGCCILMLASKHGKDDRPDERSDDEDAEITFTPEPRTIVIDSDFPTSLGELGEWYS